MHRHGKDDAIKPSDAYDLREFDHPDTTGVGILTDWPYVVVDIDGEEGARAWRALVPDDVEWLPDRWVARTGRGLHLWFQSVEPCGSMKIAEKLDLKGNGGYVAAPPSAHPDGHRYEWLIPPEDDTPYAAPLELMQFINRRNFDLKGRMLNSAAQKRVRHQALEDGILYAAWGFDSLIDGMDNAAAGNRNNYLHWAAATMAEEGASNEEFEELRTRALKAGLTRLEVTRTIRSARRAHD